MLDTETDNRLIREIHDTLTSMLQVLAADNLSQWLSLCKQVLTVASGMYSSSSPPSRFVAPQMELIILCVFITHVLKIVLGQYLNALEWLFCRSYDVKISWSRLTHYIFQAINICK